MSYNNVNANKSNEVNSNILQTFVDCAFDAGAIFLKWLFDGWIIEEDNFNILWKELRLYNQIGNMPIEKKRKKGSRSDFYAFTIPTGLCIDDFQKNRKEISQFLHEDIKDIKIELINNLACITVNKLHNISFNYEDYKFEKSNELSIPLGIDLKTHSVLYWYPNSNKYSTYHMLIAGNTGGGKSTLLYVILSHVVKFRTDVDLYIQDVKLVDLFAFENSKNTIRYNEGTKYAVETLTELVDIMNERYKYIKSHGKRSVNELEEEYKLNTILYVLEELSTFKPKIDKEFFKLLGELLARGRAAGIRVITCTQSPYSDILPGELKNNFSCIVGFKTRTADAGKVICGEYGKLEYLRGNGHGYFIDAYGETEFQGFNINLKTIENIVKNSR